MATSSKRGWSIVYEEGGWVYSDTKLSIDNERPCRRCGMLPTKEGYDACLGKIDDAVSVCCGHGVSRPILILKDKKVSI